MFEFISHLTPLFCLHSIERFPAKLFSIAEVNCRFIDAHLCLGSILNVFIIRYNVFHKCIINAIKQRYIPVKNVFDFGQREIISFLLPVTCYLS